jgi:O-antigen ligase
MAGRILTSKTPTVENPAALAIVSGIAVLLGLAAGQGRWYLFPLVPILALLWFWPIELAMGAVVVLLPFEGITVVDGGSGRGLMSLAFVLAILVLFGVGLVHNRLQKPPVATVWWGLFIGLAAASTFWAADPQVSLRRLPTTCALFLFYLAASSFRIDKKEFDWIILMTILGGLAAALMSFYQFHSGVGWGQHDIRATLVVGDTEVNPNRFGNRLLLPLSLLIGMFVLARHWSVKLSILCSLLVIGLALLLTNSRGTIIAAVVVLVTFVVRFGQLHPGTKKTQMRRLALLITTMIIVLGAAMPAAVLGRLQKSTEDRGAGRLDIWMVGLAALKHNAVIGAGLSNFPVVYQDYAGYSEHLYMKSTNDSHNIYLEIGVEEGLVGLFVFVMAVREQFKVLSLCRNRLVANQAMVVSCEAAFSGVLVAGLFGNVLWDKMFWLCCALLALSVSLPMNARSQAPAFADARNKM